MSNVITWISAEAERPKLDANAELFHRRRHRGEVPVDDLPAHRFPARKRQDPEPGTERRLAEDSSRFSPNRREADPPAPQELYGVPVDDLDRERRIYRGRTVAMLRRYLRYSLETGRLPSLAGREFFRSRVTKYRVTTFEDRVIFVHDMESCLERLDEFSREVLGRVVLQEYEHEEAARLMGCTRMTVHRKLLEALDKLIRILLEVGLLDALPSGADKSCQEGETADFFLSDCEQAK